MTKKITKKRAIRELLAICEQYPNLRNPMDEDIDDCVYFTFAVQPGQSQRCLIGEWLSRKGYDAQTFCDNAVDVLNTLEREHGLIATHQARRVANDIQAQADGSYTDTGPKNWGDVAGWIRVEYADELR
jgi:hypothetical protein